MTIEATKLNQHSAMATPRKTSGFFFQVSKSPLDPTPATTLLLSTPEETVVSTIFQIIPSMEETSIIMEALEVRLTEQAQWKCFFLIIQRTVSRAS